MTVTTFLEWVFWTSAAGVVYGYVGYALVLRGLVAVAGKPDHRSGVDAAEPPTVSVLIPAHNERAVIQRKAINMRDLRYAAGRLEVIYLCDGCTDGTYEFLRDQADDRTVVLNLPRHGKAAALNSGLERARGDIVVFTDASIMLEPESVLQIVRPFQTPEIGCVSGEDRILASGGEGLYGRYELALRRLESRLHSIVGASGSFYAQRRVICEPFAPGLAPDFLSVLRTVDRGYRAVSEPLARGVMSGLDDTRQEFGRKVRTILRGITTLAEYRRLLNPVRFGWFAFELLSHKLVRWLAPLFLLLMVVSSAGLAVESWRFRVVTLAQVLFYGFGAIGLWTSGPLASSLPSRVSLYFTAANVATAAAWLKFLGGQRQEIWSPTRR